MFTLRPWLRALRLPSLLLLSAGLFPLPTFAAGEINVALAADEGAIEGHIRDNTGTPFAGAEVRLLDTAGHILQTAVTDEHGRFRFRHLGPGSYTLFADHHGYGESAASVQVTAGREAHADLGLAPQLKTVTVTAERLERARNELSPSTGSSQYVFDRQAIQALPQGDNTPMNQVLLQAPGVANDSFGQLHIRGDHANLQYRINGVIIPEGISGFGQVLDTRFAQNVSLLTGALPAQYGYRTAGVINITTPSVFKGGEVGVYGGSNATFNPSIEYGHTSQNGVSVYGTGQFYNSLAGVEPPTDAYHPIHDHTQQGKGFGYLSFYPSQNLKFSALAGTSFGRYQIPDNPGQSPDPAFCAAYGNNSCSLQSAHLDENQYERNTYGLLALQGQPNDRFNYQTAVFARLSSVEYLPDQVGDLVFNGVAADIYRRSTTAGLQSDLGYRISDAHTLRGGMFFSNENDIADNNSHVLQTDSSGNPVAGSQEYVTDNNVKNGNRLFGVYAQDEWDLSDALTLNYGLRYDVLNAYVHATQLSPRLGLVWYPSQATVFHAGYARYFTPPPNELISDTTIARFNGTTNAQSGANDPVQAERTHYFDIGATHQFTPALNVGIDTYYKMVRQLLDEGQFGQALIFTPFNYNRGRVYGVELSAAYREGGFNAYANAALSRAQGTQIDSAQFNVAPDAVAYTQSHYIYLDHDQRLSGSAGLSYLWRGVTWSLDDLYGSGLRATSPGGVPNGQRLTFYNQTNVSAERMVHPAYLGPLKLRLAVLNLFDRQYEIRDGSGVGVGAPQFGPRIGVFLGVSKPL